MIMLLTPLQWFLMSVAVAALGVGVWYWFRTRLRYVIGQSSLRVVFGKTTVRRVPFEQIRRIQKPRGSLPGIGRRIGAMGSLIATGFWSWSETQVCSRGL